MKITWIGHSAICISGSKTVYVDPFITGNPSAKITADAIQTADVIVVTHDHGDHIGDSFNLCKKTGATLVSIFEIAQEAQKEGITAEMMNVGGTVEVKGVKVSLVPALHTAGLGGTAVGAIVEMDGKTIYHAGDTGLSCEMNWIGEIYKPDVAFLPIGGRFNMTVQLAAKAVEYIKPPKVVPIHYNTFPIIQASPERFAELVGPLSEVIILNPGESMEL